MRVSHSPLFPLDWKAGCYWGSTPLCPPSLDNLDSPGENCKGCKERKHARRVTGSGSCPFQGSPQKRKEELTSLQHPIGWVGVERKQNELCHEKSNEGQIKSERRERKDLKGNNESESYRASAGSTIRQGCTKGLADSNPSLQLVKPGAIAPKMIWVSSKLVVIGCQLDTGSRHPVLQPLEQLGFPQGTGA